MKLLIPLLLFITIACSDDTANPIVEQKNNDTITVEDNKDDTTKDSTENSADSTEVDSTKTDTTDVDTTEKVEDREVPALEIVEKGDILVPEKPMYVDGRFLYAADGEKIILRGVNLMSVWTDLKGEKMKEIARTGANCVRIVWTVENYTTAAAIDTVIAKCIENNMIPMLENHDATGKWEKVPEIIDWWLQDDMVELIKKYENYLLVNIANEAGTSVPKADFRELYSEAIVKFRDKDLNMPIILDGTNYGKNILILQSEGPAIIENDPISNVMFSVHMWWPTKFYSNSEDKVVDGIQNCIDLDLPLIVGEFGAAFTSTSETTEVTEEDLIPYELIMKECQDKEIGWLAWSWGPGNNPQIDLDMTTDGTFYSLNGWGLKAAITDEYSIRNTSVIPKFMGGPIVYTAVPAE